MRKVLVLLAVLTPQIMAAGSPAGAGEPAFWRARSATATLYIFGSIHVLDKDTKWLIPQVKKAFRDADALILEHDASAPPGQVAAMTASRAAYYNPGVSLQSELEPGLYKRVEKLARKLNLSMNYLDEFKPWYVSRILAAAYYKDPTYISKYGVDWYFLEQAKEMKKPVLGLEHIEHQLDVLSGQSGDYGAARLAEMLDHLDGRKNEITRLIAAWRAGDQPVLEALTVEKFKNDPKFYRALLVERNRRWVRKIRNWLYDDKSYFLVAGAAHFVGPNSVIRLLRAKGVIVERLAPKGAAPHNTAGAPHKIAAR